jgi:hypothetical protein
MNEDEVEFGSYLDDIFDNASELENLAEWKPRPREVAVRALVDALTEVKTPDALQEVVFVVLVTQGGGKLKFAIPGIKVTMDLAAVKGADGFTRTDACDGITDANAAQVAAQAQAELMKKYPGLWKQGPSATEPAR